MIPELISSSGPDVTAVAIPAWLDASAVAVGSVSGVLVATERKLDLVGFIVLAMLGGLGGGDDLAHVCSLSLFRSSSMLLLYHAFSLGQDSNYPFSPFFGAEKRISCAFSCVPVY